MENRVQPLVSVIIIFFNAEKYIAESIDSVINQTYRHWELLLVDDGSSDASPDIAWHYVAANPGKIHYLQHPEGANRGMSASRNLGIQHARGKYVAFLDADDLYLVDKLTEQVKILESNPEADLLYGNTRYWYSWGNGSRRDFIPDLGVPANTLYDPSFLLPRFLRGAAAVPCICSIMVKREKLMEVGGFEEVFQKNKNIYEDQAFYAKACLDLKIFVAEQCWDFYRQHAKSSTTAARDTGYDQMARRFYLNWLETYLTQRDVPDTEVWAALRREIWLNRHYHFPRKHRWARSVESFTRWLKRWMLRFDEHVLPASISALLWN